MTNTKASFDSFLKTANSEDIKKKIIEETGVMRNHGIASKAIFLVTVVVDSLVHLREKHNFDLNVDSYNEHLELPKLMEFYNNHKLTNEDIFKVRNYLKHIPSFDDKVNFFAQKDIVKSHHNRIKSGAKLAIA